MSFLSMKQYIDKPTRVTKDNKTLIDLVFVNSKVNCKVYKKPKITDHSWINIKMFTTNEGNKHREFIKRDYNKFHISEFLKALEEGIKYRDDLEVNVKAEVFVQNVVNALNIVVPKKKFKIPKIWEGKK